MENQLLSSDVIAKRIDELAKQIKTDYQGQPLVLVGVLKGAFVLLADLSRSLWHHGFADIDIDFVGITSYGTDTESSKNPHIYLDLTTNIENRHVLIIEDIIDTGYSLDALIRILRVRQPASLKTLVLLSKKSRREVTVPVDYIGFEIDGWLEGYGLDVHRHRPDIVALSNA